MGTGNRQEHSPEKRVVQEYRGRDGKWRPDLGFLCADLDLTLEPREDHAALICRLSSDQLFLENSARYIANWLDVLKADKCAIFAAASHAQRAADFINGLQPCSGG